MVQEEMTGILERFGKRVEALCPICPIYLCFGEVKLQWLALNSTPARGVS